MVAVARGLVVFNNSLRVFIWASRCRHGQGQCASVDGAIVPIDIRKDGFASLQSTPDGSPSLATTKPLVFTGSRLLVNAQTSGGGRLRVALTPVNGAAKGPTLTDCIPVSGDAMDVPVVWVGRGGNVSMYAGVPVRLTFELTSAELYSFHFAEDGALSALKSDDAATHVAQRCISGWTSFHSCGDAMCTKMSSGA